MTQFFPFLADSKLSPIPKHLAHRYSVSQMMRWDPPDPELEGPCLWSWLAPVPADQGGDTWMSARS